MSGGDLEQRLCNVVTVIAEDLDLVVNLIVNFNDCVGVEQH